MDSWCAQRHQVAKRLHKHVAARAVPRFLSRNQNKPMFSKQKRVSKELFQTIIKNGGTIASPLFVFRYLPSPTPLYAFTAPKSVAKKAVARNKLRRQGYYALRAHSLKSYAGVFFYKKGTSKASIDEIKASIALILSKLR